MRAPNSPSAAKKTALFFWTEKRKSDHCFSEKVHGNMECGTMTKTVNIAQAAAIANLNYQTFRTLLHRTPELFNTIYVSASHGPGKAAQIDHSGVLFLWIFARLIAFGIPPRDAREASWMFTDMGDTAVYWKADGPPAFTRGPAQLYPSGRTFLVIQPRQGWGCPGNGRDLPGGKFRAQLVNLLSDATFDDAFRKLGLQGVGVAAVVDLNQAVQWVDFSLERQDAKDRGRSRQEIEELVVKELVTHGLPAEEAAQIAHQVPLAYGDDVHEPGEEDGVPLADEVGSKLFGHTLIAWREGNRWQWHMHVDDGSSQPIEHYLRRSAVVIPLSQLGDDLIATIVKDVLGNRAQS
jgi:hypothetical protein